MQFWVRKVFSTALFHSRALVCSSRSSPASTRWFIKVVCALCIRHSQSFNFFDTDYFRENLNPSVAFGVVHHISNTLNNPDLAFSFFRYSRISLKLIHLRPTFDLLLLSLCQVGFHDSAEVVYEYMKTDGFFPSNSILELVVSSFANVGRFRTVEEILIAKAEICNEKETVDSYVYNKFLSMLMDRKMIDEAVAFFRGHVLRLRSFCPDTCSFNIMMRGLCRMNKVDKAFEFFEIMIKVGCYPDHVTYNTLINGLCRVDKVDRATELLREVKTQSGVSPNAVTYTSVISGYCKLGKLDAAEVLFDEMINDGVNPNLFTFNAIIDGFGKKGEMASAMKMYERMLSSAFSPDVVTFTSLIDGYCRLGELGQGMKLWDEMNEKKVPPSVFTFSVLINALCRVNWLNEARDLLRQMKGIVPPPFVYNPILDGFCKAGALDEANTIFAEMEAKGCVHDKMTFTILILGHCMKGRMYEAVGLYEKMLSMGCAPDNVTISCLISCLRKAGMACKANEIEQKASDSMHVGSSSSRRTTTTTVGNNKNDMITV